MIRYEYHYASRSKFMPSRLFETEDAARDFDRDFVAAALGASGEDEFMAAMRNGDDRLGEMIAFLAEELRDAKDRTALQKYAAAMGANYAEERAG